MSHKHAMEDRIEELEEQVESLEAEVRELEEEIGELEFRLSRTEDDLYEAESATTSLPHGETLWHGSSLHEIADWIEAVMSHAEGPLELQVKQAAWCLRNHQGARS